MIVKPEPESLKYLVEQVQQPLSSQLLQVSELFLLHMGSETSHLAIMWT